MIGKLQRLAAFGLCMQSLIMCGGTAWLRWHMGRVWYERVEVCWRGWHVSVESYSDWVSIMVVRRWPEPTSVYLTTIRETGGLPEPGLPYRLNRFADTRGAGGKWMGVFWSRGHLRAFLDPAGRLRPLLYGEDEWFTLTPVHRSRPLPYVEAGSGHEQLVAITAVWPVLWLGIVARGRCRARRRRRLNLCLKCGYDVRATPGRCPECGAVPGETAAR